MDELLTRHRKELRDLQSRITQKKKQATKKNRKTINSECDALEAETKARQAAEIAALESGEPIPGSGDGDTAEEKEEQEEDGENRYIPPPSPSPEPEERTEVSEMKSKEPAQEPAQQAPGKKRNRQKERLARRAAEMEAAAAAAEEEAKNQPSHRDVEIKKMKDLIKSWGLIERSIAPDGHCLYSAFAVVGGLEGGYKEARQKCGEFMLAHKDDFAGFLEEPIEDHVKKVMGTAEWGGQAEVMALARALEVRVKVLQAEGGVVEMGEEGGEKEVWLAYYRHSFGLGEHYNALVKKEE